MDNGYAANDKIRMFLQSRLVEYKVSVPPTKLGARLVLSNAGQ